MCPPRSRRPQIRVCIILAPALASALGVFCKLARSTWDCLRIDCAAGQSRKRCRVEGGRRRMGVRRRGAERASARVPWLPLSCREGRRAREALLPTRGWPPAGGTRGRVAEERRLAWPGPREGRRADGGLGGVEEALEDPLEAAAGGSSTPHTVLINRFWTFSFFGGTVNGFMLR